MRWLLISSIHNPGDSFARFGVEDLIREIDQEALFHVLDKENPDAWNPVPFDRAVLCGMPALWSHENQSSTEIWWWEKLFDGWITENPKRFIAIGIGEVVGKDGIHDPKAWQDAVEVLVSKSFAITSRHELTLHDPRIIQGICPSFFVNSPTFDPEKKPRSYCNLMRHGAHDPFMNPEESRVWEKSVVPLAKKLIEDGYGFVAHDADEVRFAAELGFTDIHIFFDHREYLKLYKQCDRFVGNRIHGAAMAYLFGAQVMCVAYDSRIYLLRAVGGKAIYPSQMDWDLYEFDTLRNLSIIHLERQKTKSLLKAFMDYNDH
jgi:hypothetical protein